MNKALGLILVTLCCVLIYSQAKATTDPQNDPVLYMQAAPLEQIAERPYPHHQQIINNDENNDENYYSIFYLSGTLICEPYCTGAVELFITDDRWGSGVGLQFDQIKHLEITSFPNNLIIYSQSDEDILQFNQNKITVPLLRSSNLISGQFQAKDLIIRFQILVTKKPIFPKLNWFGEINVLMKVSQDEQFFFANRLVTLSLFDNLVNPAKPTKQETSAIIVHPNNKHKFEDVQDDQDDQNVQDIQDDQNYPSILFTTYIPSFTFSLKPSPVDPDDQDGPTKSLNYLLFELTGPFEFVPNPDSISLNIPCNINGIRSQTFHLTSSTLLIDIPDHLQAIFVQNEPMSIICPKYLITSHFTSTTHPTDWPASGQFGFSTYLFETTRDKIYPDDYFVQKNSQFSLTNIVEIFSDRFFAPWNIISRTIIEKKFIFSYVSILYQDAYHSALPFNDTITKFDDLTQHKIGISLDGVGYFSDKEDQKDDPQNEKLQQIGPNVVQNFVQKLFPQRTQNPDVISTYQNRIDIQPIDSEDIIRTPSWTYQIDQPIFNNNTFSISFSVPGTGTDPFQKTPNEKKISSFYLENFSKFRSKRDNTVPKPVYMYDIETILLDRPVLDTFKLRHVPVLSPGLLEHFDPIATNIEINSHPFVTPSDGLEFTLWDIQSDIDFLEVYTPRVEFLRFNGRFKCKIFEVIEGKNDEQGGLKVDGQKSVLLLNIDGYPGPFQFGGVTPSNLTVVNQQYIHFRLEEAGVEVIKAEKIDDKIDTIPTANKKHITLSKNHNYRVSCDGSSSLSNSRTVDMAKANMSFLYPDIQYTLDQITSKTSDFLSFKGASFNGIDPSLVKPSDITYLQTSSIVALLQEGYSNGIQVAVVVIIFAICGGVFFLLISSPERKKQNDGIIDTNEQYGDALLDEQYASIE